MPCERNCKFRLTGEELQIPHSQGHCGDRWLHLATDLAARWASIANPSSTFPLTFPVSGYWFLQKSEQHRHQACNTE